MVSAARAMLGGCVDPIAFLRYENEEWDIACVVMDEVIRHKREDRQSMLKGLAEAIGRSAGSEVAKVFAGFFR